MLAPAVLALLLSPVQDKKVELALPGGSPLVFALAKASQDGQSIAVTMPSAGGSRLQTYTVNVPVTRTIRDADGNEKQVTVMRQETRSRVVTTGRPTKVVTETYVVMVPEVRTRVKDGKEEQYTVQVPVTRTRQVPVFGKGSGKPTIYKLSECTVTDIAGKKVDAAELGKRLKKKSPILILAPKQKLHAFYQAALNPRLLLLTPPTPRKAKAPVPPPAEK